MLNRTQIDRLVPILRRDAQRALRMKVRGFPRPYFCSFLLRDNTWFNTWASSGSTYRRRSDHTRNVYCDVRVGSYRYDQTTHGGLFDNDKEIESFNHVSMPIDDRSFDGLRVSLWRLSEAKYREALSDYSNKEAQRVSLVDQNRQFPSLSKTKSIRSIQYARAEKIDEERWTAFCRSASKWLSSLPKLAGNWVEFDGSHLSKVYVNTEDTVIVQHEQLYTVTATIRGLNTEGVQIEQELVLNVGSQRELPDMKRFRKLMKQKYDQLLKLSKAKRIHSYSGPVLLFPIPAGLLIHEAIGHRLEGNRLLSSGEGQTFKGRFGHRVVNVDLEIRDDPTLRSFNGTRCVGAYDFDDEGVRAENTVLLKNGVLKGFLTSRSPISKTHRSNGHARSKKHERPISRMGVTIVEGANSSSMADLRELLIREIRRQRKPYGLIIYEAAGGETETSAYDFQAFAGEIKFATIVYPDGTETPVFGVNFVGTPLQALHNIMAVGDSPDIDNSFCGAESGFIPVTTISPAILLENLELQSTEEELVTQYIIPPPKPSSR